MINPKLKQQIHLHTQFLQPINTTTTSSTQQNTNQFIPPPAENNNRYSYRDPIFRRNLNTSYDNPLLNQNQNHYNHNYNYNNTNPINININLDNFHKIRQPININLTNTPLH